MTETFLSEAGAIDTLQPNLLREVHDIRPTELAIKDRLALSCLPESDPK